MKTIRNKLLRHQMNGCFTSNARKAVWSILFAVSLGSSFALADDDTDADALNAIYELSGVNSHLSWVLSVVQQESEKSLKLCSEPGNRPDLDQALKEILSAEALRESFLLELKQRITPAQRKAIISWANSEPGQQLHKAEADAINIDEAQFSKMYDAYENSDLNTEFRTERIRTMMTNTGAVYFVSAINTEISALVSITSVCSSTPEVVALTVENINKERGEEALYRAFMRQELITPAKIIYQNVTDENVDAYIDFSNSEAGQAYFSALIIGVRSVLSDRVDQLKLVIESL